MDRTLLKTFMEIVSAGSLLAAAERLHISQTAVTVRLQRLEQQLQELQLPLHRYQWCQVLAQS